jgi:hypothetical protein
MGMRRSVAVDATSFASPLLLGMVAAVACVGGAGCSSPSQASSSHDAPSIAFDSNCETLDSNLVAPCKQFVENNARYVVPALQDVSGVNLATCYPQIHYRFGETLSPGAGGESGPDGTISYTLDMTRFWFTSEPAFLLDSHELLHLLYDCAHVPGRANYNHTFWSPVELEVLRAVLARVALPAAQEQADIDTREIPRFLDDLTANPAPFDDPDNGCVLVESYLLYGEYLRQPNRPLVREFFQRLTQDRVLAQSGMYDFGPKYEREYLEMTRDLVPDAPNRDALFARGCGVGDL